MIQKPNFKLTDAATTSMKDTSPKSLISTSLSTVDRISRISFVGSSVKLFNFATHV